MASRFVWNGLKDLQASLHTLPKDLASDAAPILDTRAEAAADRIRASYPRVTGNLKDGLEVRRLEGGALGAKVEVRNTSPHAYIYEYGTQARHYYTRQTGAMHATGRMPAGRVFVPAMIRERGQMVEDVAEMMTTHGLTVSGL